MGSLDAKRQRKVSLQRKRVHEVILVSECKQNARDRLPNRLPPLPKLICGMTQAVSIDTRPLITDKTAEYFSFLMTDPEVSKVELSTSQPCACMAKIEIMLPYPATLG